MDVENDYFLVKFQNAKNYEKVYQGPWIMFGQNLTVQSWTLDFNPMQPFPSVMMARISLPDLPGIFYKRKILEEIGGLVGKVAKLDFMGKICQNGSVCESGSTSSLTNFG
ncbi:hypothetical protein J1N35_006157 [Gossypium stocksii]|uniref:DUF4283 domain-containing protein n=1 Tax=Gossypium stocksii TaxID=47602 RepID=A0A9D3WFF5_9ROSI|nr:hypothetical protein J1N35_006157 [Gossypium stocksii]